ncbi:MAG: signal recognition particle-docking protein FtsY, partial [Verrucomicrobiae bacterium]|nr:signal recognition particle-docking protein FtsY [Verrucomicrobiae bacterium]
VVLMVGVNGTGKTTSAAKLAAWHGRHGRRVRMAAADTFRAAAGEQLEVWGARLGVPVTTGAPGSDPAAVAFRAVEAAKAEGEGVVIVDTAGRQHTRHNLMAELAKVARVLQKHGPDIPQEALLVVDANTGGNALAQAREFSKAVRLTGLVASKLDGSGLGGGIFAIRQECGIPPAWAGTGERLEDFGPFDADTYLDRLFAGA